MIYSHYASSCEKKDCRVSTGSLIALRKYYVSPLGDYHEIKQEKRLGTKRSK
jgi:hypothetical protein